MIIPLSAKVVALLAIVITGGFAAIVTVNYVCLLRVDAEYYVATLDVTNHTPFTVILLEATADIYDSSGQRIAVADAERPEDQDYVAVFEQNITVTVIIGITLLVPESQFYSYTGDEEFDVHVSLKVKGGLLTVTIPHRQTVTAAEIIAEMAV